MVYYRPRSAAAALTTPSALTCSGSPRGLFRRGRRISDATELIEWTIACGVPNGSATSHAARRPQYASKTPDRPILTCMSWQWWLTLLGVLLVFAGATLALIGFRHTWNDFISDRKFSGALTSAIPAVREQATRALAEVRYRLRRGPRPIHDGDQATSVSAQATISWKILPAEYPEDKELSEVLRDLWDRHIALQRDVGNYIQTSTKNLSTAEENLSKRVTLVDEQVIKVAVGGLALQAWGLILVTAGAVLAAIPSLTQM